MSHAVAVWSFSVFLPSRSIERNAQPARVRCCGFHSFSQRGCWECWECRKQPRSKRDGLSRINNGDTDRRALIWRCFRRSRTLGRMKLSEPHRRSCVGSAFADLLRFLHFQASQLPGALKTAPRRRRFANLFSMPSSRGGFSHKIHSSTTEHTKSRKPFTKSTRVQVRFATGVQTLK